MQGPLYQAFFLEADFFGSVGIFKVEVAISFSHMHPDKESDLSLPDCPLIGLYWLLQRPPGVASTTVEPFHLHLMLAKDSFRFFRHIYRARIVGRNGHFLKCLQSLGLEILP